MKTPILCRLAACLFVFCLVSVCHAAPPSCGRECKAKAAFKPNCLSKGCSCADKCDCQRLGRCSAKCKCATSNRAYDALDQLNAQRKARGLRPYIRDEGLTRGAMAAAKYRAQHLIQGHVMWGGGDFAFLPRGVHAPVAGCAAWPNDGQFGSCEMYGTRYRYAGAATCIGPNGQAFHHLFCR